MIDSTIGVWNVLFVSAGHSRWRDQLMRLIWALAHPTRRFRLSATVKLSRYSGDVYPCAQVICGVGYLQV
jgi:hypothetical protein